MNWHLFLFMYLNIVELKAMLCTYLRRGKEHHLLIQNDSELSQSITASRSKEETKRAHRAVDNFSSCGNRCIATALAFSTAIDLLNLRNRSILDSSAFRVYGGEWQLNTQLRIVCSSCRSRVSGSAWSRKRRPSSPRISRLILAAQRDGKA